MHLIESVSEGFPSYSYIKKYTDIYVEKMRETFALQKLLTLFQQKYWRISEINVLNFNETITNDVVSFKQPGSELEVIQ